MNPCDTGLNHRKARWPERRKPRGCQGISYRNQPGKLCLDERLSRKTALAHGRARAERKCRYQEDSSKHSNKLHALILFRTHRIRQSKSATRRGGPPVLAIAAGCRSVISAQRLTARFQARIHPPPSRLSYLPITSPKMLSGLPQMYGWSHCPVK